MLLCFFRILEEEMDTFLCWIMNRRIGIEIELSQREILEQNDYQDIKRKNMHGLKLVQRYIYTYQYIDIVFRDIILQKIQIQSSSNFTIVIFQFQSLDNHYYYYSNYSELGWVKIILCYYYHYYYCYYWKFLIIIIAYSFIQSYTMVHTFGS